MPPFSLESYRSLIPPIAGLALSTLATNISLEEAHRTTGVSAGGGVAVLVACAAMLVLFLCTLKVKRFSKRVIFLMTFLSIHIAGLAALILAFLDALGTSAPELAFGLTCAVAVGETLISFYWMRKLRGTSAQAVVVVAFCALAISEFATFVLSFSSPLVTHIVSFACAFAQFATMKFSRAFGVPSDVFPAVSESYFGTDEHRFSSRSFLVVAAIGIWFISVPMGMGRGFSAGQDIYMSPVPRFMVLLLVLIVSGLWIRAGLASKMRTITTSIWVAMELMLAFGAMLFAVWPNTVSMGAAFVMASALVLDAFVLYLAIAFISFGWRDPYYYAAGAWVSVRVLTVLGMKFDGALTQVFADNTPVIISIMSLCVLVSTQVVFTRLLAAPGEQAPAPTPQKTGVVTQDDVRRIPLMGVLAISAQNETPLPSKTPDVHIATSVIEMGQRFGLTGREIEVLTLYALGHTQARVSEELKLSTNTVHTHIKRIYDKTDLHSRQEILDYINQYGK